MPAVLQCCLLRGTTNVRPPNPGRLVVSIFGSLAGPWGSTTDAVLLLGYEPLEVVAAVDALLPQLVVLHVVEVLLPFLNQIFGISVGIPRF